MGELSLSSSSATGRTPFAMGRVSAFTPWRAVTAFAAGDRETAAAALLREAAEYGADAVAEIVFEVEECHGDACESVMLRRLVATGCAVRLSLAA